MSAYCKKLRARAVKAMILCGFALVAAGCVSQDSSYDFGTNIASNPTPSQAIETPSGVILATGNDYVTGEAPQSEFTQTVSLDSSFTVPTKAPRPGAELVGTQPLQQPVGVLAVADPAVKTEPAVNVIASAIIPEQTVSSEGIVAADSVQEDENASIEVASLSPTGANLVETPVTKPTSVRQQGFFQRLFGNNNNQAGAAKPAKAKTVKKPRVQRTSRPSSRIETANLVSQRNPRITSRTKKKKTKNKKIVLRTRTSLGREQDALPGVKSNDEIFGIQNTTRDGKTTRVAAVGSFGRLSPNDLRVQHSKVQVACLKPGLLKILKRIERHYRKKPIITSGYRSPKRNRRAGGARNSQHIFCKAVDIQVEGVSKWDLAKYLRSMSGRGGVGTYCRTKSVHIDIGSKRDWHHPCRRSSKRKRKKA